MVFKNIGWYRNIDAFVSARILVLGKNLIAVLGKVRYISNLHVKLVATTSRNITKCDRSIAN